MNQHWPDLLHRAMLCPQDVTLHSNDQICYIGQGHIPKTWHYGVTCDTMNQHWPGLLHRARLYPRDVTPWSRSQARSCGARWGTARGTWRRCRSGPRTLPSFPRTTGLVGSSLHRREELFYLTSTETRLFTRDPRGEGDERKSEGSIAGANQENHGAVDHSSSGLTPAKRRRNSDIIPVACYKLTDV